MPFTGERPVAGRSPAGLLALHDAGYAAVRDALGPGRVLDLGCGVGDGTATLVASSRTVIGVDYDDRTAAAAVHRHPGVAALCADGARLGVRDASFDTVCSSHLIEHFVDPRGHVGELARVVRDDGTVFVLTPNAPMDVENPYHLHLFTADTLTAMLGEHFAEVTVVGLDGDEVVHADFAARRRAARRLLALDVFGLRHRLGRRAYIGMHVAARRIAYPLLAVAGRRHRRGEAAAPDITAARFALTPTVGESTLVLFAQARRPRRGPVG